MSCQRVRLLVVLSILGSKISLEILCFNVNLSVLPAMFKVVTRPVAPGGVNAQLGQIIRFSSFLPSLGRW